MLPSQVKINYVYIIADQGRVMDASLIFTNMRIRESMDMAAINGDIVIQDDNNHYEILPIIGQEQIQISFEAGDIESVVTGFVYKIGDFKKIDGRRTQYTLYFVSMEQYFNQNNRVRRSYTNLPPSDIIHDILNNDIVTEKNVIIEEMGGNISYLVPNITPFKAVNRVLKLSTSSSNGTSNFVFFENRIGFIVASLSSLLTQQPDPLITYGYSEYIGTDNQETTGNITNYLTIEDFKVLKQTDTMNALTNGMFKSELHTIDLLTRTTEKYDYDYFKEFSSFKHMNKHPLYKDLQQVSDSAEGSQYFNYTNERALENTYVKNNQSDMNVELSSKTRLRRIIQNNMLDAYVFKLVIPGNITLHPSNIININITSNRSREEDNMLSGKVMITSIAHVIGGASRTYRQVLETVKDSHNRGIDSV
jgi:hypothetical protein